MTLWPPRAALLVFLAANLLAAGQQPQAQESAPEFFTPGDDEITPLSGKAATLTPGATRTEVIALLGPADWVVLPTEKSEWGLYPEAVLLMLYWDNGPCTAVAAAFGPDDKMRLVNSGRIACVRQGSFPRTPDKSLTCAQEYRAQLCK
ncbi:MAG: hypothetical protein VX871_08050 [Pseudomonadota bacterium]|nr:hypothetical protein [Pseudomonadota bacterium]